jgi:hypothetical protein
MRSTRICLNLIKTLLMIGVGTSLSSCSSQGVSKMPITTPTPSVKSEGSFHLHILQGDLGSLELRSDWQTVWDIIQRVYPTTIAFSLTENDVESYDWSEQVIVFTPEASSRLISTLAGSDSEKLSPAYATQVLGYRAFLVTLNDQPIYGGVFMLPPSAMGIKYPVIYAQLADEKFSLKIRPIHSFTGYASVEPDWNGIRDEGIHDLFNQMGKLSE